MKETVIKVKNLRKDFEELIFKDVSFEINKGDAVVILGGSGCGKSTLLRCINRLIEPTDGEIYFKGENILSKDCDLDKYRQKVGMVFQSFNLFSHLNVYENLILAPMRVLKMPKDEAIKKAKKLLEIVGMENKGFNMPSELSGGQKQRVAIARSLMMDPEVLLFDEPTSALDPTMVDEVENVIKLLIDEGLTCAIVTHDMNFAKKIATKVIFLAEKGIYETSESEDFFTNPKKPLTKKFLFNARLKEFEINKKNLDIYNLGSEIRKFASQFGFTEHQNRGKEYALEEILLPIINNNKAKSCIVRFVGSDSGIKHMLSFDFEGIEDDPLKLKVIDQAGLKLISGFSLALTSTKKSKNAWEINIEL